MENFHCKNPPEPQFGRVLQHIYLAADFLVRWSVRSQRAQKTRPQASASCSVPPSSGVKENRSRQASASVGALPSGLPSGGGFTTISLCLLQPAST
mgnify:CR=1 FL=1